jgi:hypothetical protein
MEYKKWGLVDLGNESSDDFYLHSLCHEDMFLTLLLKHEKTKRSLRIKFHLPLSYRNVDEGDLLKSSGTFKAGFFFLEESPFLEWFHDESYDTWRDKNVIQYCIYTPNDCVDVLTREGDIEVEWLD